MAISLLVFVRVITVMPPTWMWYHDSHFYFLVAEGMLETNSFQLPQRILDVYGTAIPRASRFAYPSLTLILSEVTGVTNRTALRLGIPILLTPLFFVGTWALYERILPRPWAISGTAFLGFTGVIFGHQIQYHEQGFAVVTTIFFLLSLVCLRKLNPRRWVVFILCSTVLILSHPFTPELVWIALSAAIGAALMEMYLPIPIFPLQKFRQMSEPIILYSIILIALTMFFVFGLWREIVLDIYVIVTRGSIPSVTGSIAGYVNAGGTTLLNEVPTYNKGLLTLASLPVVYQGIRGQFDDDTNLFLTLAGGFFAATITAYIVNGGGAGSRSLVFAYLFLVPFSLLTLRQLSLSVPIRHLNWYNLAVLIVVGMMITLTVMAATPMSLIDPDSDIKQDGYHNVEPIGKQAPTAGFWVREYVPKNSPAFVNFQDRMLAIRYGRLEDVSYLTQTSSNGLGIYDAARSANPSVGTDQIYSNGRIYLALSDGPPLLANNSQTRYRSAVPALSSSGSLRSEQVVAGGAHDTRRPAQRVLRYRQARRLGERSTLRHP